MMRARGMSMCACVLSLLSTSCSEEAPTNDPGRISLDVTDEASIAGTYDRNDVPYRITIETVSGEHHLSILEPTSRILLSLQARQTQEGEIESFAIDWTTTELLDEDDLAAHRGLFADLGAAARAWGAGSGATAPAWIVPLLELPSHLVPPRPVEDELVDPDKGGPITTVSP